MNLRIEGIRVGYQGREVLKGCSHSFQRPGIYILTGENGCGKSTLLRICALLERPDEGMVRYFDGGDPLQNDINLRRRITLVLPRVGLFNASVYDNVAYGLRVRNMPEEEIREKTGGALEFVRLSRKAGQNALTLSSGEAQRLGIARAMIIEPEVLFLDEPTASVDKYNIPVIEEIIHHLKDSRRIIIMATHDERQAGRLGDEVLVMDEGMLTNEERAL